MLFVIVVEVLHVMMEKSRALLIITGYSIDNSSAEVSNLQFSDDTIVLCDSTIAEIESLKVSCIGSN